MDKETSSRMRLVVDTNILISALISDSSVVYNILRNPLITFYIPDFGIAEVERYRETILKKLKRKSGFNKVDLDYAILILMRNIKIVPFEYYQNNYKYAYNVMKDIDAKDTTFIALALTLKCSVWSNDKHFKMQDKVMVYTTEELLGHGVPK